MSVTPVTPHVEKDIGVTGHKRPSTWHTCKTHSHRRNGGVPACDGNGCQSYCGARMSTGRRANDGTERMHDSCIVCDEMFDADPNK